MKKSITKIISLVMVIAIFSTLIPFAFAEFNYDYADEFELGTYPQSQVTDERTINALNSAITDNWISFGYFSAGAASDYMQYQDITISGEKYRAVKLTKYRPEHSTGTAATSAPSRRQTGFALNTIYYFKYEPIVWQIIDEDNDLAITKLTLDSQVYTNIIDKTQSKPYSDYNKSDVKVWLENTFTETAFSNGEDIQIKGKVRLAEKEEIDSFTTIPDGTKLGIASDYSRINGLSSSSRDYKGVYGTINSCVWWTGSVETAATGADQAFTVTTMGGTEASGIITQNNGIRPVIQLDDNYENKYRIDYTLTTEKLYNNAITSETTAFGQDYIYAGDNVTVPEITKDGYTFSGWNNIPDTMPAENITLEGILALNKHQIKYIIDNDESTATIIDNIPFGSTITTIDNPVKDGYTFSGWADVPETMPDCDVTITGSFTQNTYTITYYLDGEYFTTQENLVPGTAITTPEAPSKDGYTFSGWADIPESMPSENISIYGTYTENKTEPDPGEHTHSYTTKYDENNSWNECTCGEKADVITHTFITVTTEPTETKAGSVVKKCTSCDYKFVVSTTPALGPKNPTANAVIKQITSTTVKYRSIVKITATATNVPKGYYVALYEGNKLVAKGDNKSASYTVSQIRENKVYTVKIIDAKNITQKDGNNNLLESRINIYVNSRFFTKLIAFFKALFGRLPVIEVK